MKRLFLLALALVCGLAAAQKPPWERIRINEGWRFTLATPGMDSGLPYDARPEVKERRDDKQADAEPAAAEKIAGSGRAFLKPAILPIANEFIKNPARRYPPALQESGTSIPCAQKEFDDSSWAKVTLPHDWAIAGPFYTGWGDGVGGGMGRLPSPGIGWYRRKLEISTADAGKSIFLDIDGAMSYAMVWLNGRLIGGWPYGYNSWRVDLTRHVMPGGTNQIAIRLDNPPDSSRWYPGGGLYRNVWLVKTSPLHVSHWGTFVDTPYLTEKQATVKLKVTLDNDGTESAAVSVSTEIFVRGRDGRASGRAVGRFPVTAVTVSPGKASAGIEGKVTLANPKLWGPPPQAPNLYLAVTTVQRDGTVVDRYETPFGIRSVQFDPAKGIIVNGQPVRIQGVNLHHDLGALGAAFNRRAAQRQLEILREMGCNAVRMSHNPPAPELLDLTDEMGFLVVDEIFDQWERKKTPLDFHLIFPEWHEADLRALIRRDRNHPSVFLWSIGNEVGEQYTGEEGAKVAEALHAIARDEDSTRPTTTAMNYAKPNMPLPGVVDVIGLNYQGEGIRDTAAHAELKGIKTPPQYPAFHQAFPDKMIISTETAAALSSRGEYLFPVHESISAPVKEGMGGDSKRQQVSAYELYAADFGSSADKVFAAQDKHPYVAGEFVWSGWDYLGEPTPYYGARSSYFGIIDLAGFKKDRFYLYQSRWRPELPMAHILPHWTWPERVGKVTPVHVFTSGDEAELFLNGKSMGRKKKGSFEYRLRWEDVVYEPGTLEVVAYKNNTKWAADRVKTAGPAFKLIAEADRREIYCDGSDLAFVTVRIVDREGQLVPRGKSQVEFKLEGEGDLVATDNGDPTNFEPFTSPVRKAFNGLCLAIVRSRAGQPGQIKVTAGSENLQPSPVKIQSRQPGR